MKIYSNVYYEYNQFRNISCYEEFEMLCTLAGISKIIALKRISHRIDNYYFFVSMDGIFNWFDLNGNHIKDPHVLKVLENMYFPCNITNCIIPDSISDINYEAFSDCESLKEITIPNNVVTIGHNAFSFCSSLTSINIPNSVRYIGNKAFFYCESLISIIISDNIIRIGDNAFFGCHSLKDVIFKGKTLEEVKQMRYYPFGIEDESKIKCEN